MSLLNAMSRHEWREFSISQCLLLYYSIEMLKGETTKEIADAIEEDIEVVGQIMQSILRFKKGCEEESFDARKVLKYYQCVRKVRK